MEKAGKSPPHLLLASFPLYRRQLRRRGKNRQIYLRFSQSASECRLCLHSEAFAVRQKPFFIFGQYEYQWDENFGNIFLKIKENLLVSLDYDT